MLLYYGCCYLHCYPAVNCNSWTSYSPTVLACSFDNDVPAAAQTALNTALAAWVTAQTAAVQGGIAAGEGCSPVVTNDFDPAQDIIDLCTGGAVTVTWTITDLCFSTTVAATYTVTPPSTVTPGPATSPTVLACSFDNDVPAAAQTALNTALAAWVTAQTAAVQGGIAAGEGCSPVVTNDFDPAQDIIDLCTGGAVTVTWTITDLCFSTTVAATYTVTPPSTVTPGPATSPTVLACSFDNDVPAAAQTALNTALAAWVTAQTAAVQGGIAAGEGCSPVVTNDFDPAQDIIDLSLVVP